MNFVGYYWIFLIEVHTSVWWIIKLFKISVCLKKRGNYFVYKENNFLILGVWKWSMVWWSECIFTRVFEKTTWKFVVSRCKPFSQTFLRRCFTSRGVKTSFLFPFLSQKQFLLSVELSTFLPAYRSFLNPLP